MRNLLRLIDFFIQYKTIAIITSKGDNILNCLVNFSLVDMCGLQLTSHLM